MVDAKKGQRRYAWIGFSGLVAQFGVLGYFVWEVLSWDVMEPFCYFLGMTSVVGSYIYFAVNKRDMTYPQLFEQWEQRRFERLCIKRGFDDTEFSKLRQRIQELEAKLTTP